MRAADAILGQPNEYADLYDPWRKLRGPPLLPSYSPTFFKNTISVSSLSVLADIIIAACLHVQKCQMACVQQSCVT